jgi:hypothetical protein
MMKWFDRILNILLRATAFIGFLLVTYDKWVPTSKETASTALLALGIACKTEGKVFKFWD